MENPADLIKHIRDKNNEHDQPGVNLLPNSKHDQKPASLSLAVADGKRLANANATSLEQQYRTAYPVRLRNRAILHTSRI